MELVQAYNNIESHHKYVHKLDNHILLNSNNVIEVTFGIEIGELIGVYFNESTDIVKATTSLMSVQLGRVRLSADETILVEEITLIWN